MTISTITNPLKKDVEQLSSYQELSTLNKVKLEKVMGTDADWLITTDSTTDPSKPDKLPDNQVYQSLEHENEWLWETIDLLNKGYFQNKLWLDSIEDISEADQAITDLLKAVVLYWRTYLESDDPKIFEKMPVLGSRFKNNKENRAKAFDLVSLMDRVLYKEITIEDLLTKWHGGKEWSNYNKKYDFDNSLWAFTQLLYLKKKYQAEATKPVEQPTPKKQTSTIGTQTEIKKLRDIDELIQEMPGAFPKS